MTLAREAPPPPPPRISAVSREVLVVGGGVGGCQAALDLANAGFKVYLAETSLSIGGTMAQLDKTFPTLDCSICILGPKLVEVAAHPDIELLTYATLEGIAGEAGHFEVDLVIKPRYVNMSKCVGCGTCATVCPVIVPSRWNLGLKPRKCIRIIFAQAVPLRATIEREYCIDCQMCVKACEHQAINLLYKPTSRRLTVGAIVLATGARPFDPAIKSEYGYGRLGGVVTSLEYERLVCATGPTQGSLVTPAGRPAQRVAFIQCVGSRDRRFLPYCSGFCCTASIKQAMLALEHEPEAAVTIFYNDIRTSGKGFEELYQRARHAGVRFIKGLPGQIREGEDGGPVIFYEDQRSGEAGAPGRGPGGAGRGAGGPPGAPAVCGPGPGERRPGLLPGAPSRAAAAGIHGAGGVPGRHLPGAPGYRRNGLPGERRRGPGHQNVCGPGRKSWLLQGEGQGPFRKAPALSLKLPPHPDMGRVKGREGTLSFSELKSRQIWKKKFSSTARKSPWKAGFCRGPGAEAWSSPTPTPGSAAAWTTTWSGPRCGPLRPGAGPPCASTSGAWGAAPGLTARAWKRWRTWPRP